MVTGIGGGQGGLDVSALWRELLQRADKDGDGQISKSDFKSALAQNTDSATADQVFDTMDTNQDGFVSVAEYLGAMQKLGLTGQSSGPQGFSTLA